MKKKNIVGHMIAPRESVVSRFRRWQILPRFWCILLALLIWLVVVNTNELEKDRDRNTDDRSAVTEQAE